MPVTICKIERIESDRLPEVWRVEMGHRSSFTEVCFDFRAAQQIMNAFRVGRRRHRKIGSTEEAKALGNRMHEARYRALGKINKMRSEWMRDHSESIEEGRVSE